MQLVQELVTTISKERHAFFLGVEAFAGRVYVRLYQTVHLFPCSDYEISIILDTLSCVLRYQQVDSDYEISIILDTLFCVMLY